MASADGREASGGRPAGVRGRVRRASGERG